MVAASSGIEGATYNRRGRHRHQEQRERVHDHEKAGEGDPDHQLPRTVTLPLNPLGLFV